MLLLVVAVAVLMLLVLFAGRNNPPVRQARGLYVSDFANMLSWRQRNFIRETSARALEETGVDIAVLTVRNMRNFDIVTIEEFAWQNAIGWGLGGPDNSAFALLVYNREDGRAFIAAGNIFAYGPLAPEAAHVFIEENMRPFYEVGRRRRGGAIFGGYRAMVLQAYAQVGVMPGSDLLESLVPGAPLWDFDSFWLGVAVAGAALILYRVGILYKKRRRGYSGYQRRSRTRGDPHDKTVSERDGKE
jgi:uncharacterized membrane protein YgcG